MAEALPETINGKRIFRCGTLTYVGWWSLITLFLWLLWGDFVFTLMEELWPKFMKLFLIQVMGLDPDIATWLRVTIPQAIGVFMCPIVSFKSDRHRGKWGRRIPFMILTAPMLSLFLGGLGFSGDIVQWLRLTPIPAMLGLSPAWTVIIVVSFLVAGFSVFNEFVGSVYWYLFNDVVPKEYIGRFLGFFRFVGGLASILFYKLVYPHSLTHSKWILFGASILYFVGFSLMCLRVKEGQYPPVTDVTARTPIFRQIALYFKDCFTHPIYILLFLSTGLTYSAGLANTGEELFLINLGISLFDQGDVISIQKFIGLFLNIPAGWVVDKFHPLRMVLITSAIGIVFALLQYFFLWSFKSYAILTISSLVFLSLNSAASIPLLMRVFPQKNFGQFCSANGAMRSLMGVIISVFAGLFASWISHSNQYKPGYRLAYLWSAAFLFLSLLCMLAVYRYWKRLGGDKHYQPPLAPPPLPNADQLA